MINCLHIHRAPVAVSLQDSGRKGFLRYGVAPAGPMDWARHAMVNQMLSQSQQATAIEVGPAGIGLTLESGALRLAILGIIAVSACNSPSIIISDLIKP